MSSLEMSTSEDREVASASWKARETEMMKSVEGYKVQLPVLIWSIMFSLLLILLLSLLLHHSSLFSCVRQVQCEQHALTIVALEDKLLASVHEVTQLRGEKAELQNKIRELEEQIGDPSKNASC